MTAFATHDELAAYMQATFTVAQNATADLLLDLASDEIRSVTGQQVDVVTDDTVDLEAPADAELILPQRPASEPTSVLVDGVAVTDWTFKRGVLYRRAGWTAYDDHGVVKDVTVTYSHGWATPPAELKRVALQAVARAMRNPDGLQRRATGSEMEAFAAANDGTHPEVNLTDAEVQAARRAVGAPKRRTIWLTPDGSPRRNAGYRWRGVW